MAKLRVIYFEDGSSGEFTEDEVQALRDAGIRFSTAPIPEAKGPDYSTEPPKTTTSTPKVKEAPKFTKVESDTVDPLTGDPINQYSDQYGNLYQQSSDGTLKMIYKNPGYEFPDPPTARVEKDGILYDVYFNPETGQRVEVAVGNAPDKAANKRVVGQFTDRDGSIRNRFDDGSVSEPIGYDPESDISQVGQKTSDTREAERIQLERDQLGYEKERDAAALQADKEARLAQLKANPGSWLEYSTLSGQSPVVQPWMMPLRPQGYSASAGEPLPGWNTQPEQPANLTELTTPGAQYYAQMSPDMRAQYMGYEKARTGQTEDSTDWRLWSRAPGAGKATRINYTN